MSLDWYVGHCVRRFQGSTSDISAKHRRCPTGRRVLANTATTMKIPLDNQIDPLRFKKAVMESYETNWFAALNKETGNKLDTYRTFKSSLQYEEYLSHLSNAQHRRALTQLRTSAHSLRVETGRYEQPQPLRQDRVCPACKEEVEDEAHVIIRCKLYEAERKVFCDKVSQEVKNFCTMGDEHKFLYLMVCEDRVILTLLAKYTWELFQKRKVHVK